MSDYKKMYWNVYPRPQMRRGNYYNLNGEWKLNGERIVVPFPPQSALSEYKGAIENNLIYELDYEMSVDMREESKGKRVLLHFGAIDQKATIYLNECELGTHIGGYLPFEFDVTQIIKTETINHLRIEVEDTLNTIYPYGKQSRNPGGMWYTPVSGIWQSVWMEIVPQRYIKNIKMTPDLEGVSVELEGNVDSFEVEIVLPNDKRLKKSFGGKCGYISIKEESKPVYWSCDNPYLYNMTVRVDEDLIETYFALRTIEIKEINGVNRVCLNGKPVFMHGVLDQGYFEDGIFLPQSPEEYEKDILRMKELGFNMLRKHIKVEPEWYYYYCDKHGMLVVQDMVNSGAYSFVRDTLLPTVGFSRKNDKKAPLKYKMTEELSRRAFFEEHMKEILQKLYNHPSIIVYTIFNEGWGQFESDRMYDMARKIDGTRLYDATSGWFMQQKSDFDSKHVYFRTIRLNVGKRPLFLSECGGYTLKVEGHLFNDKKSYGYGKCTSGWHLTEKIVSMYEKMVVPAIEKGLCGCVYTQLSDIEDEINGLYTYDRQVCKIEKNKLQGLAEKLSI